MARINGGTAEKLIRMSAMVLFAMLLLMTVTAMSKYFVACAAESDEAAFEMVKEKATITANAGIKKWSFLSAAIAVGLGSIAGGIAVAYVGAAALGVIAEKPEAAGRALIFVGLAEGIAIYGVIVAILILFQ